MHVLLDILVGKAVRHVLAAENRIEGVLFVLSNTAELVGIVHALQLDARVIGRSGVIIVAQAQPGEQWGRFVFILFIRRIGCVLIRPGHIIQLRHIHSRVVADLFVENHVDTAEGIRDPFVRNVRKDARFLQIQ